MALGNNCLSQSLKERMYREAVNDGPSTGPPLLIATIVNCNTKESKELVFSANEIFNCLKLELKENNYKKITPILLANSYARTFFIDEPAALSEVNFERNVKKISRNERRFSKTLVKRHIIDTLIEIQRLSHYESEIYDSYENVRKKISAKITDSISKIRTLTKVENRTLNSIWYISWDGIEEEFGPEYANGSKAERKECKFIIDLWKKELKQDNTIGIKFRDIEKKINILERKYFEDYKKKYGAYAVAKVLIKHGVFCYYGDENPGLHFGEILKE